jgi:hypothetical protein
MEILKNIAKQNMKKVENNCSEEIARKGGCHHQWTLPTSFIPLP